MSENIITTLESQLQEKGLHMVGGLLKKLIDKKVLENIFVEAGEFISNYEYDKTEQSELRAIVFDRKNMIQLADAMYEVDEFAWIPTLESYLEDVLGKSALTIANQQKCKKHFVDIVRRDMQKAFAELMQRNYARQTYDNSIETLGQLEQQAQEIHMLRSSIDEILLQYYEDAGRRPRQEKADRVRYSGWENATESDKIAVEWKLKGVHVKGIWASAEEQREEILQLTQGWRQEREAYPGWYIMPYSVHQTLAWNTQENGLLQKLDMVSLEERLEFCYEYVWRCERGMLLYDMRVQTNVRKVWQECASMLEKWKEEEKNEYFMHWFYIGQVLLREYREDGKGKDWNTVCKTLEKEVNAYQELTEEQKEELREQLKMEAIKQAFALFDIPKALREIRQWNISKNQYALRLQCIGILAECGEVQEAMQRLESLKQDMDVRLQEEDSVQYCLFLKTMRVAMLQLESLMLQGYAHEEGEYEQQQEQINKIVEQIEAHKDLFDWQHIVNKVKSELLDSYVKKYEVEESFELNREITSLLGGGRMEAGSYYLYRILDVLALPLEVNRVTLMSALELPWISALFGLNTHLALFMLVRGSKSANCKKLVNRRLVVTLPPKEIVDEIRYLMDCLEKNLTELTEKEPVGHIYRAIQGNVPELLKRYVSRCPEYLQKEVLLLVKKLMETEDLVLDNRMDLFLVGIMNQISEKAKAEMLGVLINTKIYEHSVMWGHRQAIDLFDYYFRKTDLDSLRELCRVEPEQVEELLEMETNTVYEWRTKVARLELLDDLGLLNAGQKQQLGELVWSRLDEKTLLPDMPNRYVWVYVKLPHVGENVPAISIKAFLLQNGLMKTLGAEKGCNITFGEIRYLDELHALAGALEKDFWTMEEVEQIFTDALCYWQVLKDRLAHPISKDVEREYRIRVCKMVSTLAEVYNSISRTVREELRAEIAVMLTEMQAVGVGTLQLEVLIRGEEVCPQIQMQIYAVNNQWTVDALQAAYAHIVKYPQEESSKALLNALVQVLYTRKRPGLLSALYILHNLLYVGCSAMTEEIMARLDEALQEMEKATNYTDFLADERQLKETIALRKACVALSYQMWIRMNGECGEGVRLWKAIAKEDAFSEVRNEWFGAYGLFGGLQNNLRSSIIK